MARQSATGTPRRHAEQPLSDPGARRLLALLRAMSPAEAEAWFRVGRRLVNDVPAAEAEAAMAAELVTKPAKGTSQS